MPMTGQHGLKLLPREDTQEAPDHRPMGLLSSPLDALSRAAISVDADSSSLAGESDDNKLAVADEHHANRLVKLHAHE